MAVSRRLVLALVGASSVFAASPARAAGRVHDGFQFRGAVGPGYLSTSEPDSSIHGGAGVLEIYLGGTPVRGLTVGGYFSVMQAVGPTLSVSDIGVNASSSHVTQTLFTIGPYVDFYPDPRGGLHILGALGYANLAIDASYAGFAINGSDGGFAIGGGVGYDWWVSSDWSLGILGRLTVASTSDSNHSETTVAPAILFSFSYN